MFVWIGALLALLAVALGAFGAHALRAKVTAERLAVYQTGVQYQMYHALALLFLGVWSRTASSSLLMAAGWLFIIGVILFSGSLYTLTVTGVRRVGAITPVGGLCFLAGWVCVLIGWHL